MRVELQAAPLTWFASNVHAYAACCIAFEAPWRVSTESGMSDSSTGKTIGLSSTCHARSKHTAHFCECKTVHMHVHVRHRSVSTYRTW